MIGGRPPSLADSDKRARKMGRLMMLAILLAALSTVLDFVRMRDGWVFPSGAICLGALLGGNLYVGLRVFGFRLREMWAMWFGYTVDVDLNRFSDWNGEDDPTVVDEVVDWCRYNCRGLWVHETGIYWTLFKFWRKSDAALFKLWWG